MSEQEKLLADGVPLGEQLNAAWKEVEGNVQWLHNVWEMVKARATPTVREKTAENLARRGSRVVDVLATMVGDAKGEPPADPVLGNEAAAPVDLPRRDLADIPGPAGQFTGPPAGDLYNPDHPGNWTRDKQTDQFIVCIPVVGSAPPAVGQKVMVKNRAGKVAHVLAHKVGRPFVSRFGDYEGREVVFVTPPPREGESAAPPQPKPPPVPAPPAPEPVSAVNDLGDAPF